MKFWKHETGRLLTLLLAGAVLASCTAHGQGSERDPKVYVNYTPYSETFYRELITGRVNLYAPRTGKFRNVVHGMVALADGRLLECLPGRADNKLFWFPRRIESWSLVKRAVGVMVHRDYGDGGGAAYASPFYDPETGSISAEVLKHGRWIRTSPGVVQNTWPRVLVDGCPTLKLPAHIRINEKQTSPRMDELRRQDPDAPIRHFPGSHLTAPGRTGLGASRGAPTTTRKEVWDYLRAQNGYVVTSPSETDYVLALGRDGVSHEVWKLGADGEIEKTGVLREEEDWILIEVPDQPVLRYPVGYPVPVLPTGHRHPAFQLTGELVAVPEPRALAFMGEGYADNRFVFYGTGRLAVVDLAGDLIVEGSWRWTQGRLEIAVDGDAAGARSVGWRELADQLGKTPAVWKPLSRTAG